MSDLVVIGKVSSARGLKGQFKIISYTKNAEDIFNYGPITIGDKYIDVQLSKVSATKNLLVVSVHEIDTREKAEDIINNNITVKIHKFPEISEDGQYYYHQINTTATQLQRNPISNYDLDLQLNCPLDFLSRNPH